MDLNLTCGILVVKKLLDHIGKTIMKVTLEFNLPEDTILIGNISAFVPFKGFTTTAFSFCSILISPAKVKLLLALAFN